jgi:hypothetical protein
MVGRPRLPGRRKQCTGRSSSPAARSASSSPLQMLMRSQRRTSRWKASGPWPMSPRLFWESRSCCGRRRAMGAQQRDNRELADLALCGAPSRSRDGCLVTVDEVERRPVAAGRHPDWRSDLRGRGAGPGLWPLAIGLIALKLPSVPASIAALAVSRIFDQPEVPELRALCVVRYDARNGDHGVATATSFKDARSRSRALRPAVHARSPPCGGSLAARPTHAEHRRRSARQDCQSRD